MAGIFAEDISVNNLNASDIKRVTNIEFNNNNISIGNAAGKVEQSQFTVAIGFNAGNKQQQQGCIAIGSKAGQNAQSIGAVAVGNEAGRFQQSRGGVAVGSGAGADRQGEFAIAIGTSAGEGLQGNNSIAIGKGAGESEQPANSIILNASGVGLNPSTASALYVNPVRNATSNNILYYNTSNKEISYDVAPTITGAASTIVSSDLTINSALISNGSGKVAVSSITSTQLGYLSGATSNIQTQINDISSGSSSNWDLCGNDIINKNSGNVGIGTDTPSEKLQVDGNLLVNGGINAQGYEITYINKGASWQPVQAAEQNNWQSVAYGNGVWIAVSSDGTSRVMRSTDGGISWQPVQAAEQNNWQSVAYGNGVWIAVSFVGTSRVMRSTNGGISWQAVGLSFPLNLQSWRSVAYGNEVWVAVAGNTFETATSRRVMRSTDGGISWSSVTTVPANVQTLVWRSVAFGDGVWIAVAYFADSGSANVESHIIKSTDNGQNWVFVIGEPSLTLNYLSVAYGDEVWIAVTANNRNYRSIDGGESWVFVLTQPFQTGGYNSVAYGNGVWIAVSSDGFTNTVLRSTNNGESWVIVLTTENNTLFPFRLTSVAYGEDNNGNEVWVAVSSSGTNRVMRSIGDPVYTLSPNDVFAVTPTLPLRIGIGTTSPSVSLDVSGTIKATDISVNNLLVNTINGGTYPPTFSVSTFNPKLDGFNASTKEGRFQRIGNMIQGTIKISGNVQYVGDPDFITIDLPVGGGGNQFLFNDGIYGDLIMNITNNNVNTLGKLLYQQTDNKFRLIRIRPSATTGTNLLENLNNTTVPSTLPINVLSITFAYLCDD